MAKTFDINRVGGGTFSLVRDADGNYSLKEEGFQQISSLNMIDLGAVAATTTAAKTETAAEKAGISTADQTKQAFLLPSQDKQDPFTFEKTLKSATDVSKGLSDSATQTMIANQEAQEQAAGIGPVSTFSAEKEDSLENRTSIKSPTETVFGTADDATANILPDPKVETAAEKTSKLTSANVQSGKVPAPGFTNPFKDFLGDKFKTEKGSEVTQAGKPGMLGDTGGSMDRMSGTMPGTTFGTGTATSTQAEQEAAAGTLGISADPAKSTVPFGTSVDNIQGFTDKKDFISTPAKKTFVDSISTALQGVGDFIKGGGFAGRMFRGISKQRNEDAATIELNRSKFNVVTSSGSMQGRIVGNDGSYNPSENLFHGMNRDSSLGNLQNAGQKRIDKRNSASTQARIQKTMTREQREKFNRDTENMEKELSGYKKEKVQKKGLDTGNPNEMRNANKQGGNGGSNGGKSIVCTAMYQTTGLQDWAKAMKIWYIYQKRYLTIQHQEGYHKLFKPFVKGMHKSNAIKAIGAHFAKYRTQHLKHVLFKSKPSLLGKVYSKVLETICYWAGKK